MSWTGLGLANAIKLTSQMFRRQSVSAPQFAPGAMVRARAAKLDKNNLYGVTTLAAVTEVTHRRIQHP